MAAKQSAKRRKPAKRREPPNWFITLHQFVPTPGDEDWCQLCGGVRIIWIHQLPQT